MSGRVVAALLVLAALWGSAFPLIKVALEDLGPGHLTLARHVVASACFVAFLLLGRKRMLPRRRDVPSFFLLGVLGFTIYHLALNFGELRVTAGAASLLIATAPAITAILAHFLLHEHMPRGAWLGSAVAFGGVALIVAGDGSALGFNPFALFILLSAASTALFAVLQRRMFRDYEPVEVTAFATWAGTVPMLVFLPGLPQALAAASLPALGATVFIGIVPSAIAYTLFAFALSKAPANLVTAFLYLVPVSSLSISWWLLGEVPSPVTLIGGLVAIAGIIVVNVAKRRQALRAAPPEADAPAAT